MRSFYYRSGRNAFLALLMAAFAIGSTMLWFDDRSFISLAFAGLMAAGAARATFNAMSHEPALKFDDHSIWIKKAWGGLEEVAWRDVHDISAKVFTMRYMGIIPVGRSAYVTVTCEGGFLGARRLRVSTTAMGLSPAETGELLLVLKRARLDAVGEAGIAMAGAGSHGWGAGPSSPPSAKPEGSSGFDPDAALARYLASKEAGTSTQAAPAAPALKPSMPQRPEFGRRVG